MPRIERILRVTEHRVHTGETLESVARANGLTWEQLAKYNWGTTDPQEVNNRLRTHVGCTRRPPNSRFYVFDDADDPGIILIPGQWSETGLETDRPRERPHIIRVRKKQVEQNLVSCWRVPGFVFPYDKSFIRPRVARQVDRLQRALAEHPDAKIMIFGHTDRCGPEEYNKQLSDRRALSVYAFVTHQPTLWETLYGRESWGLRFVQEILADLGFDPGPTDGQMGSRTAAAMRRFLGLAEGAPVRNDAGFRAELFRRYMVSKWPEPVAEARFIPPKHVGCGELNPAVDWNDHERAHGGRGEPDGNPPNRRVLFFLFKRPPRDIACVRGDMNPCRSQEAGYPDERHNRRPDPKFKCAFYDRIAAHCPCESPIPMTTVVRLVPNVLARKGNVLAYAERLDGHPFPETDFISLGNLAIEEVWSAPDGRVYFIPPNEGDGPYNDLSLTDTGEVFRLQTQVTYTNECLPSIESIVYQMAVLREATQLRTAQGREAGEPENDVRLRYDTLILDGHRRLEQALNRIDESSEPASEQEAIVQRLAELIEAHGGELDQYLSAMFPPQVPYS